LIFSHQVENNVPLYVIGDPTRLVQILINLCGNAIKFTEKGMVTIEVEADSENASLLTFKVSDTGIGISDEQIKELDRHPDVVVLDYVLNTVSVDAEDGMAILQKIKKLDKHVCVIMLSSQEQYGKALQTIIKGALEYVVKGPDAFERVEKIIEAQS
jgi:light-regulated signal transduction histidine kinase (bacteriophytochrome)